MSRSIQCAYCGRVGSRGFMLRFGDGQAPQTGDWCCSNRKACDRRVVKRYRQEATS